MNLNYTWDLTDIFKTMYEFENEVTLLIEKLEQMKFFEGILKESPSNLFKCYNLYEKALEHYRKIYAYGMLKFHLDMADNESIKLFKRCEGIGTDFKKISSFIVPEITKIPTETLKRYIEEDKSLKRYERELKEIIKDKKHILNTQEESLLASLSDVFNVSENSYSILTNAEFHYGYVTKNDGTKEELTDSNYILFLKDKDEHIRKQAFDLMYAKYKEFINTITELYLAKVKETTIISKVRKYKSSLEKTLEDDDATIKVFNGLIEAVHQNLNVNHRFMKLKHELLKKEDMHIYDCYVNPVETEAQSISFEDAKKEVISALEVMGNNYLDMIKHAFDNRWIDVYPKANKRNGGYMMSVYGVHPYILLNYVGKQVDVSTIIHELGHAIHSHYSHNTQNVFDCDYTLLIAEIASTTNEILLAKYKIENENDKNKKAELIYELLEMIRATLYNQTMLVEFEQKVHSMVSEGKVLSAEDLCNIYYKMKKMYFGSDCFVDDEVKYEWARIPHFYSPFYVYTYATGISAAIIIANNIWDKKEGYVEKYINMLKQGCTKKAVELLKMVDVDLEDINTYKGAIEFYNQMVKELTDLLH